MGKWLKETIPGIVLLGTIGSVFAVATLKFFGFLFRRYFIRLVESYKRYELKSLFREAFIMGVLSGNNDNGKLAIYLLRNFYLFTISSLDLSFHCSF